MQKLTKAQLASSLAEAMQSDKKVTAALLDHIAQIVPREMIAGGSVTLPSLGKFSCLARPER